MSSEINIKAREIFLNALEKQGSEQIKAYVNQACGKNELLRKRVAELFQAQQNAGEFLQTPDLAFEQTMNVPSGGDAATRSLADSGDSIGSQIGPYKLLQEIGEGGMGTVYMAEQEKPVRRRVALKVIKPGMDTKQVVARFEAERQALAMMDHPNIANVLDAGTTNSGRPYFVMELIKGLPITQYCDEKKLSIKQRLELFKSVINGVQHAHQKGIIHRDLKPSNVLVAEYDKASVPKIIDFGLAKALNQNLTEKTMFTQLGQVVGTLEYMSPEQSMTNQQDVDTRTDIYSLGLLLYELLAGVTPFDKERLRSAALDQILKIIREEDPPIPSLRLSSADFPAEIATRRGTEQHKLSGLLRGELDWIVMKALEKDRSRRYDSTTQLSHDLENYLSNRPVMAGPPSTWYQLKKAFQRNRRTAGSLLAVFLVLLTFLLVVLWKNAELKSALKNVVRAEGEATAINYFFIKEMLGQADPDMNPYQEKTTVVALLDRSAREIESSKAFRDQPEVDATIRLVIGKTYFALGRWNNSKVHLDRALSIRRQHLGSQHPKTLEALASLVDLQIVLEELDSAMKGTLELEEGWLQNRVEHEPMIALARINRSKVLIAQGQYPEAESLAKEVLETCEKLGLNDDVLIQARQTVADVLSEQYKDLEIAQSLFEKNLETLRAREESEISHAVLSAKFRLAEQLIVQGHFDDAESLYSEVFEVRINETLPADHPNTIKARIGLGRIQLSQGKFDLAMENFLEAHEQSLKTLGEDHAITWLARHAIVMAIDSEIIFVAPNMTELSTEARKMADQMKLTCDRRSWPKEHSKWHQTYVDLAHSLLSQGMVKKLIRGPLGSIFEPQELGKAEEIMIDVHESSKSSRGPTHPLTIESGMHLNQLRLVTNKPSGEMENILRELRDSTQEVPDGIPAKAMMSQALGSLLTQTNRSKEAEPYLREYYLNCQSREVSQFEKINSRMNLLRCLRKLGREEQLKKLSLEKNETYHIRVTSPSSAPMTSVHSGGRPVDALYNHDRDSSHLFVTPLRTRTYTISTVPMQVKSKSGEYDLRIERCEMSDEQTFEGELNSNSPVDSLVLNHPRKVVSIPMKSGCLYRLEAKSSAIRPHIRIEDEQGRLIKWISGAPRKTAILGFSPEVDGEFRVVLVPTKRNSFGTFSLSVKEYTPTGEAIGDE